MTLQVTTGPSPSPDVVVLALSGTPAEDLLALVADGIAELTAGGQTVVVDLDGLVMTSSAAMRGFLARLIGRSPEGRIRLKCGRLTGRKVLRRWCNERLEIVPVIGEPTRVAPPAEEALSA